MQKARVLIYRERFERRNILFNHICYHLITRVTDTFVKRTKRMPPYLAINYVRVCVRVYL